MADLAGSGAIISPCKTWRYRLDRHVGAGPLVYAYFGVNGSTATGEEDDQTVRKWSGFSRLHGVGRYIVGNPFAFRAKNVRDLAKADDPIGPDNDQYLAEIIGEADVLVPCWGNVTKVPRQLRYRFADCVAMLRSSGKPMRCFGLTRSGCPRHPLMLGYETPMIEFT